MSYVALERAETGGAGVAVAERPPGRRRRPSAWHLLLIPIALVMLFPFVWLVITSVSTLAETRSFPPSLPAGFPLQWIENAVKNYGDAWTLAPFGRWVLNTTVVTVQTPAGAQQAPQARLDRARL